MILRAGKSLTGEPIRFIGKEMFLKIVAGEGPGSMCMLEDATPAGQGPPLHAHPFEEWFYVVQGRFLFGVDGVGTEAGVGDLAYAPADVPHVFQNVSDGMGRLLVICRPGGVETYFQELAQKSMQEPGNVAALAELGKKYGVRVLGPPVAGRK